jgi:hypothetical protein
MSAVDTIQEALFGNPPTAGFKPSREGVLAAFTEIYTQVVAATVGMVSYTTKAALLASPAPAAGTQARVYADTTPANNGVYVYKSGAWSLDTNFYAFLVSIVQPSITAASDAAGAANTSAILAGHFANDSTDVAVPGQADPAARGAKYWSTVMGAYATAFGAASDLLPAFSKVTARTALPANRQLTYGRRITANGAANFGTYFMNDATMAATRDDYIDSFFCLFGTALAGRQIEFYIARPSTGAIVWRSGLQDCPAIGVFNYTPPLLSAAIMAVGDIMGAVTTSAGTNGVVYETTTGFNVLRSGSTTRLAVGATYATGTSAATTARPAIGYVTRSQAILLNSMMLNVPNGVPDLDSGARIRMRQVPKLLLNTDPAALGTTEGVYERRSLRTRRLAVRKITQNNVHSQWFAGADSEDVPGSGELTVLGITQNWPHISWLAGGQALTNAGVMTSIEFPAGGTVGPGGGSYQVWAIKQPTLPDSGTLDIPGEKYTFVGEAFIPNPTGATIVNPDFVWLETPAIYIDVNDAIQVRAINAGLPYATANVAYSNDRYVRPNTYSDLSITAFDVNGLTATVASGVRVPMKITTRPGSAGLSRGGKNANMALDHEAYTPAYNGRKADMPWRDKVLIVTGTSIEAGEAIDSPAARSGHVWQMFDKLQCIGYNEGVGSSRVDFGSAAFVGSMSGNTLTITSIIGGMPRIGQTLSGTGITPAPVITGGAGLVWTFSGAAQTVASTTIIGSYTSTDNISLGATKADFIAVYGATTGAALASYSFESKVIDRVAANPGVDIVWFDMHGFNDAGNSPIGLITDTPGAQSYYAVKKRMYDAFYRACETYNCTPHLRLATCTHEYDSLTLVPARRLINAANRALADLYSAPIFDAMAITEINPTTISRGTASGTTYPSGVLPDRVHPRQMPRDKLGKSGYTFLKGC